MPANDNFCLKTDSEDFATRLNSVFDGITTLEQNHETWRSNQDSLQNERFWKPEPCEEASSSLEAKFKRPSGFPLKRRLPSLDYVPNFQRNPAKWTKYSLADVPELSEQSNQRAAMSFLEDRKRQKLAAADLENSTPEKIIFHRPKAAKIEITEQVDADNSSSLSKNATSVGKFVMPECIVGVKKTRSSSQRSKDKEIPCTGVAIHLDHLEDEENETRITTEEDVEEFNSNTDLQISRDVSSGSGFHKFAKKLSRQVKHSCDVEDDADDNAVMHSMDLN